MPFTTKREYGLLCDRSALGLGRVLLRIASNSADIDPLTECGIRKPHNHDVVTRLTTFGEWEPIHGVGNFTGMPE
jgi:hypothetical protein